MSLWFEKEIKQRILAALQELYGITELEENILLQETKKEFEGDKTLVVFPYTKKSGKSPEDTAMQIGTHVQKHSTIVSSFNVVKGFLNLVVSEAFWAEFFSGVVADPELLFHSSRNTDDPVQPRFLMVEYSSPNTNKPLHLGHIRNNLLGFSVSEILRANGHKVVKVNLVNDRGIHICKSMLAWQKWGHGETPSSSGMKGDHLVGKYYVLYDKKYKEQVEQLVERGLPKEEAEKSAALAVEIQDMLRKWEAGDPETRELWQKMNGWVYDGFAESYKKLGVDFDKIYYESETYLLGKKIVEEGVKSNSFFRKEDQSVWVDLTAEGLDQKVLLRSDGTSVYITQDIGTAQQRFDEYPGLQQLIYVVGNEQDYHFKVLRGIFHKLNRPWADGLYHLSYGMVDLPSGKMKSREGTVVDADDLIKDVVEEAEMATKAMGKLDDFDSSEAKALYHTLGMGAIKYFILKVDPKKRMLFNPAESIDLNGNTGPFIQYTHARICSVLKKGEKSIRQAGNARQHQFSKEEKHLIRLIYHYPQNLREAGQNFSPAIMANYAYDLAKAYNHFYHDHVIVDEADPETSAFRLSLSRLTAAVIKQSMKLLGINVPERM
ncbi:MAG TPA: arginine--tRNA ligase [Bacteroidia bacterium]|nr:arginine--tRNA ligase [Bacteroidia bacterium]